MAAAAASAGLGLLGLYNQQQQQKKQNELQRRGLKLSEQEAQMRLNASKEIQNLATNYNPEQETTAAIQRASEVTGDTLVKSMRNLVADYAKGGGIPGLSSMWNVKTQGLTNRVTDPLRAFAAERATGDTQRKIAAWQAALSATPGNLGDSYFKASSSMNPGDPSGSMSAILAALQAAFGQKGGGSAGGSGDWRTNSKTGAGGWNA